MKLRESCGYMDHPRKYSTEEIANGDVIHLKQGSYFARYYEIGDVNKEFTLKNFAGVMYSMPDKNCSALRNSE
ncbi:MAG: hypothetical protein LBH02_03270 [Methanocalculaceae archaeon]|jgi:hypothetical protein|nr:hypothetical protein [Methanocalculaceae archaeon]